MEHTIEKVGFGICKKKESCCSCWWKHKKLSSSWSDLTNCFRINLSYCLYFERIDQWCSKSCSHSHVCLDFIAANQNSISTATGLWFRCCWNGKNIGPTAHFQIFFFSHLYCILKFDKDYSAAEYSHGLAQFVQTLLPTTLKIIKLDSALEFYWPIIWSPTYKRWKLHPHNWKICQFSS